MADNTTIEVAKNGSAAMREIYKLITISAQGSLSSSSKAKRRAWRCTGAPTVDAGSQSTYPVLAGDYLLDQTAGARAGYTCTVSPTANTAGTFVKLHA